MTDAQTSDAAKPARNWCFTIRSGDSAQRNAYAAPERVKKYFVLMFGPRDACQLSSPIVALTQTADDAFDVRTRSGSRYALKTEDMDPRLREERLFQRYLEKMSASSQIKTFEIYPSLRAEFEGGC